MLVTGIEVEARPPGKKVKRLSLLSGGERGADRDRVPGGHLQGPAVAVLRARRGRGGAGRHQPAAAAAGSSPSSGTTSQLIIVTHQQRTMEVADTLYGISMRGDGVSTVVSQRLRERGERLSRLPRAARRPRVCETGPVMEQLIIIAAVVIVVVVGGSAATSSWPARAAGTPAGPSVPAPTRRRRRLAEPRPRDARPPSPRHRAPRRASRPRRPG